MRLHRITQHDAPDIMNVFGSLGTAVIGEVQMLMPGIISYYVGLTFQENKGRPVYFVNQRLNTLDNNQK